MPIATPELPRMIYPLDRLKDRRPHPPSVVIPLMGLEPCPRVDSIPAAFGAPAKFRRVPPPYLTPIKGDKRPPRKTTLISVP
eukprot:CAMPEP_0194378180 /NCGR_PEP_ID=MMETSP0174-20130528/34423_1 /TAXON_ID=216777 /ORGANISM="Proboscia alata, Strain PI-D3" /LENGTH=81 /DNA_ID=CAMNT_0039160015 /DNA_START=130 /DNA_END=371 /DNA_ORIENTATION=+